jgi:hypothetical protein
MRLINVTTFELKDFGANPPFYAILLHTWGEGEVSFQDMADLDAARQKKGFAKIEHCCRQARRHGLSWAWVDTCCIDKASSAELSETINSMFQWYPCTQTAPGSGARRFRTARSCSDPAGGRAVGP